MDDGKERCPPTGLVEGAAAAGSRRAWSGAVRDELNRDNAAREEGSGWWRRRRRGGLRTVRRYGGEEARCPARRWRRRGRQPVAGRIRWGEAS